MLVKQNEECPLNTVSILCPLINTESQLSFRPICLTAFWSSLPLKCSRSESGFYGHCKPAPLSGFLIVCVSLAAIVKYHRLGGLNDKCLFLTVLEAGKSKIKVPADLVPRGHCHCWMSIAIHMPPSVPHSHTWH